MTDADTKKEIYLFKIKNEDIVLIIGQRFKGYPDESDMQLL